MPKTTFFSAKLFRRHQHIKVLKFHGALPILLYTILNLLMVSCSGDGDKSAKKALQVQSKSKSIPDKPNSPIENVATTDLKNDKAIEVMEEKDILFNGRLKRYFSFRQFQAVLGEPDSAQLLSSVEPCTNIFQEPDGSVHPEARYLYKNGSRFECSLEKVALEEVNFSYGDFIIFRKQTLNKHTTLAALKKLFPNATAH